MLRTGSVIVYPSSIQPPHPPETVPHKLLMIYYRILYEFIRENPDDIPEIHCGGASSRSITDHSLPKLISAFENHKLGCILSSGLFVRVQSEHGHMSPVEGRQSIFRNKSNAEVYESFPAMTRRSATPLGGRTPMVRRGRCLYAVRVPMAHTGETIRRGIISERCLDVQSNTSLLQ